MLLHVWLEQGQKWLVKLARTSEPVSPLPVGRGGVLLRSPQVLQAQHPPVVDPHVGIVGTDCDQVAPARSGHNH